VCNKTPEEWLEQAAPEKSSGIFKVFLGYAPGVGKTYNMLSEAIRRSKRGEDVVIGVVETHGRMGVAELIGQLPVVNGNLVSTAVADFVREQKITQVIFGRSTVHGWKKYLYLAAMNRFLANAPAVDVHIVTQETD
jgi:K+-sensing histidine kinase KdpD